MGCLDVGSDFLSIDLARLCATLLPRYGIYRDVSLIPGIIVSPEQEKLHTIDPGESVIPCINVKLFKWFRESLNHGLIVAVLTAK
jgi:hypothetical protein